MNTVKSPVLLIIFNRLETSLQVLEAIAEARPAHLFIAGDGARPNRSGEEDVVRTVREAVLARIDWPCCVETLFRETNLGCREGVRTAIDWFFANVPAGIILEDDVVPSQDFFTFCDTMLETYVNDERVYMVSGTNLLGANVTFDNYFFSSFGSIWGWASWRRAWLHYDVKMNDWATSNLRRDLRKHHGRLGAAYLRSVIDGHIKNDIDTWDTQWLYTMLRDGSRAVIPQGNLITNIGVVGTHSSVEMSGHYVPHGHMRRPLRSMTQPDEENVAFRNAMVRKIYLPAMAISAASRVTKQIGLHSIAKQIFNFTNAFRK